MYHRQTIESQFVLFRKTDRSLPMTKIIVTQPRRLAAISLAQRMAAEIGGNRGEEVGQTVGYRVSMDKNSGRNTKLIYATSGYLIEVPI